MPSPSVEGVPTPAPARPRDSQRSRVYAAEDFWAAQLDAARLGAEQATIAGSSVVLPGERRFGTLAGAQDYTAALLADPRVVAVAGALPAPALRTRRGATRAHWEPPGVIALPVPRHGEPWGLREVVLLHELAHHVGETTGLARGHGAPFPALVALLAGAALGEEAVLALRVSYGEHGVEVGAL